MLLEEDKDKDGKISFLEFKNMMQGRVEQKDTTLEVTCLRKARTRGMSMIEFKNSISLDENAASE